MRILIADALDPARVRTLEAHGHECRLVPTLTAEELPEHVAGHDVLVVRSTRVTARTLRSADRLQLVVRAGAGTNTIDLDTAAELGIYVCNVPGRNAVAVAELAMGLLLALDRNIPDNVAELRAGRWDKKRFARARGIHGTSVAVLGLGAIGLEFAARARAFGMEIHALEKDRPPSVRARIADLDIHLAADLPTLLGAVDVVSLHVPLTDETRGMVDRGFLGALRDGAWIINTSRGELVDAEALLEALDTRGMRAALDVFPDEPATPTATYDSRLARHPSVYGTHHIGASTAQAQASIADGVVEIIDAFTAGRVLHCVDLETETLGETTLLVRHRDRVGVLSAVLTALREAGINIQQMENRVFRGAVAAVATLHVEGTIDDTLRSRLAAIDDVIQVTVRPRSTP